MTTESIDTIERLKGYKNKVIGNLSAKAQLSQDPGFLQALVKCLSNPSTEIRIEAAHITSSISLGSDDALASLLRVDALRALLKALKDATTTLPVPTAQPQQPRSTNQQLQSALSRALRSLIISAADIVGPSLWGLRPDASAIRNEAQSALDVFFQVESLDVVLPLLVQPHVDSAVSVAQLLAQSLRIGQHRTSVTEWVPVEDRLREVKSKRGWEKASAHGASAPGRQGGWVARGLVGLLSSRAHKVQEAALLALAALAKDNLPVASALVESEVLSPVANALARSRVADVQLAGCLCATHIIRAYPLSSDAIASTIISVLKRFISPPSTTPIISPHQQLKACYILFHLVIDDPGLCQLAFSRGCLLSLGGLLSSLTIVPAGEPPSLPVTETTKGSIASTLSSSDIPEDLTDEPPTLSALREASLIALTALALHAHDIRMAVTELDVGDVSLHPALTTNGVVFPAAANTNTAATDTGELSNQGTTRQYRQLLPLLRWTLYSPHTGVRYATAELIRALSRSIAVLRTSVVDSGLGTLIVERVMDRQEDRRVIGSALRAVANGLSEYSPLRPEYVKRGLIGRLVEFVRGVETHRFRSESDEREEWSEAEEGVLDTSLRPLALWAMKNLIKKSVDEVKMDVMAQLGWKTLAQLMVSGRLESHHLRHGGRRRKPVVMRGKTTRRESFSGGIMGSMDIDDDDDDAEVVNAEEFSDDDTETEELDVDTAEDDEMRTLQQDTDTVAVQEQAINVARNLAENENGIDMVFEEFGKLDLSEILSDSTRTATKTTDSSSSASTASRGSVSFPSLFRSTSSSSSETGSPHPIIAILTRLLSASPTAFPDVTLQATYALANLANGSPVQQALILNHPPILRCLKTVIADSGRGFEGGDVRQPAIGVVLALAKGCAGVVSMGSTGDGTGGGVTGTVVSSLKCRQEMIDAGVVGTLKRICESQGGVVGVGIGVHHHHHHGVRSSLGVSHHSLSYSHGHPSSVPSSTSPAQATPLHSHAHSHVYPHSADSSDKEVVDLAKQALDWLDHGEGYGST
ncbi:ARM repeat-containing protein [Marasmius fiardii PR-910]|nr:ARM repeat-containing protein [Marasmius fiardii PR-910]